MGELLAAGLPWGAITALTREQAAAVLGSMADARARATARATAGGAGG